MFGKHFESMYTGSMVGHGSLVFAVWGYVIAHTRNSLVELNPALIAAIFGNTTEQEIQCVIDLLCSPDPNSRSKKEDGKRLVKQGQFIYFVPTFADYHGMRNDDERRSYMRNLMRDKRKSKLAHVSSSVSRRYPQLAQSESESEADNTLRIRDARFAQFWEAYPVHKGKQQARKALDKLNPSVNQFGLIMQAIGRQKTEHAMLEAKKQFVPEFPYPATWLNQARWDDECLKDAPSSEAITPPNRFAGAL
jgi:hypothetical protein